MLQQTVAHLVNRGEMGMLRMDGDRETGWRLKDAPLADVSAILENVAVGRLPAAMGDLLQHCQPSPFYQGRVPILLGDHLAILTPHTADLFSDLEVLKSCVKKEDTLKLENEFWTAISRLPSYSTSTDTLRLRRIMRHNSWSSHRRRVEGNRLCNRRLKLMAELSKKRAPIIDIRPSKKTTSHWKPMLPASRTPLDLAERKWKAMDTDDEQIFDEVELEMAEERGRTQTRIVVRRDNGRRCWGEVFIEGNRVAGPFLLGVDQDARMYLLQFLEMITEGGRKQPISVRRLHCVGGGGGGVGGTA